MKFRTLLLGLSALFVAFNAAFFSVTGLSKLFAGASLSVILMASSLELAKLIVAGYLYNYWEKINKVFRVYLIIGTSILVLITSLGIYGFLTSAFQDTFNVYSVTSKQKTFLQQKESFWADDVARYDTELKSISDRISQLSGAKSQQIQYRDEDGNLVNTVSTRELRLAQERLSEEDKLRKEAQSKREIAADSLQSIQLQILELDTNTEVGSELGPLQYLSGLLNKPMDQIINWFILIIIFVFDPLAVALVVAFNNAMKVDKGEDDKKKVVQKRELYGEDISSESMINENITELNDNEGSDIYTEDDFKDWDTTLSDGLDDVPYDTTILDSKDTTPNTSSKKIEGTNVIFSKPQDVQKIFDDADLNQDGVVTDEERKEYYEREGWKSPYKGKPYYLHPWFDWSKRERWINNRPAIEYWINYRGGSQHQLEKMRESEVYPDDFTKKTY